MKKSSFSFKRIDWTLVLILLIFFCISLLAISSAQTTSYTGTNFIPRQIIYYGLFSIIFIFHIIKTALKMKDSYSMLICTGIVAMLTFHVFENIGMTIQLLPITGIPLPLISYGGSSLMGNALALGLIFSMHFYHRQSMFSTDDEEYLY